ncbi:MAG: hypothetical protein M9892_03175 [Bacteroidetes bacterium]|nr:hypothetical protein [Bacteroidota bacterium]
MSKIIKYSTSIAPMGDKYVLTLRVWEEKEEGEIVFSSTTFVANNIQEALSEQNKRLEKWL